MDSIIISVTGIAIFQLENRNHKLFVIFSALIYIFSAIWYFSLSGSNKNSMMDYFGINLNSSDYISIVFSLISLILLYSGSILLLFQEENIEVNSDKKALIKPLCYSFILYNSMLFSLVLSGIHLYWKMLVIRFIQCCFEGFIFLMTGSSLACWTISIIQNLLTSQSFTTQLAEKKWIKIAHLLTVFIFIYTLPILMNPYLYTGIFYKMHAKIYLI